MFEVYPGYYSRITKFSPSIVPNGFAHAYFLRLTAHALAQSAPQQLDTICVTQISSNVLNLILVIGDGSCEKSVRHYGLGAADTLPLSLLDNPLASNLGDGASKFGSVMERSSCKDPHFVWRQQIWIGNGKVQLLLIIF